MKLVNHTYKSQKGALKALLDGTRFYYNSITILDDIEEYHYYEIFYDYHTMQFKANRDGAPHPLENSDLLENWRQWQVRSTRKAYLLKW